MRDIDSQSPEADLVGHLTGNNPEAWGLPAQQLKLYERAATRAFEKAWRRPCAPRSGLHLVWADFKRQRPPLQPFQNRARDQQEYAAALRVTLSAREFFTFIDYLVGDDLLALADASGNIARNPLVAEILKRNPAAAAWWQRREAQLDEIDRANEIQRQAAHVAYPALLIGQLKSRGVILSLGPDNEIMAPPGTVLPAMERQILRDRKPEFVAVMKSLAEAARPTALA